MYGLSIEQEAINWSQWHSVTATSSIQFSDGDCHVFFRLVILETLLVAALEVCGQVNRVNWLIKDAEM